MHIIFKWLKCTGKLSQKKKLQLLKKKWLHQRKVYKFSELHKRSLVSEQCFVFMSSYLTQTLMFSVCCLFFLFFYLKNCHVSDLCFVIGLCPYTVINLASLTINFFFKKLLAVPKKPVPEDKAPVPIPRKVAAPPAKGIQVLLEVEMAFKCQTSMCIILTVCLVNQICLSWLVINEKTFVFSPSKYCWVWQRIVMYLHFLQFLATI